MNNDKVIAFQAQPNVDPITLICEALQGKAVVNESMSISTKGEVNVKISLVPEGFKIDFLPPEPVAAITKFITLSDTVDYIIVTREKKLKLKIRTWPAEISIDLPQKT